jgi:hypothetical protein
MIISWWSEDVMDRRVDDVYSQPNLLNELDDDKIFTKGEN